jgi:ComF family protein
MNSAPAIFRQWTRTAAGLLWPARCAACDDPLDDRATPGFCRSCASAARPVTAPFCAICAEPFQGEITSSFSCQNCLGRRQQFDFAVAAWLSRGPVRTAIHHFKYGRRLALREPLARLLATGLADPRIAARSDWLLVPVPLHPRRFREREFNQSEELARSLARLSGLPFARVLRRTRYTSTQAALRREDRLGNLKGAFALRWRAPRLTAGRAILLIDDVLTTGSTANACSAVLRKAGGAEMVAILTVARG